MAIVEPSFEMDKLSYEIFSILESKFLFGYDDPKLFLAANSSPETPVKPPKSTAGKVRILSIDGGSGAADGLLAGVSLARLESSLRKHSNDPTARIADFFDVVAGSGTGGVLAAMLFTRGPDGKPLFSAEEALWFLAKNRRGILSSSSPKKGIFRAIFRKSGGIFRRIFKESTLRDTVKPVLIPCYDLSTGAPFLFSRADAMERDGYNFKMREVCAATCADRAVEMRSVDEKTGILAVGGGLAMGNPTSAAITHVLNNKQEFPFAAGMEDLLVVSLGSGEADSGGGGRGSATPSTAELVKIAGNGVADTVDQAVAMAFGHKRTSNYVRIQANGFVSRTNHTSTKTTSSDARKLVGAVEEMLAHRNVESVLFRGKKISEQTNAEKLKWVSGELIKEHVRRKSSPIPTVLVKQAMTPRTSSVESTATSTLTTSTGSSTSS